jgi:hypothetical protein
MARKAKVEPGAMLEMAAPEILAKMEAPEPKTRRMRLSRGFKQAQRELGRAVTVVKTATTPTPSDEDPFAEARRPTLRNKHWKVGELDDYTLLTALPPSGKCTCGTKPYNWTNAQGISNSKRDPNIGYFCSHTAHGGNGRFWLFSDAYTPKKRGRPRKVQNESATD